MTKTKSSPVFFFFWWWVNVHSKIRLLRKHIKFPLFIHQIALNCECTWGSFDVTALYTLLSLKSIIFLHSSINLTRTNKKLVPIVRCWLVGLVFKKLSVELFSFLCTSISDISWYWSEQLNYDRKSNKRTTKTKSRNKTPTNQHKHTHTVYVNAKYFSRCENVVKFAIAFLRFARFVNVFSTNKKKNRNSRNYQFLLSMFKCSVEIPYQ